MPKTIGNKRHFLLCLAVLKSIFPTSDLFCLITSHLDRYDIEKNHSCETQLMNTIRDIALLLDQKHQVDIIMMDFLKAFDRAPHKITHQNAMQWDQRENASMDWVISNTEETEGSY